MTPNYSAMQTSVPSATLSTWRPRARSSSRPRFRGPRSREILERLARRSQARSRSRSRSSPPRARGATLTDVDGNTFIDFAGGVGCLNVGHSPPGRRRRRRRSSSSASPTPTSRSSRTSRTSRSPSGSLERTPISGPAQGGVLQRRHRGGRERGQVRARLHRPAGRDRVRGRLPRPHDALALADLEDAPVQGRARAVRARGLPRAVPERLPRRRRPSEALGALERAFVTLGRGRERRRDRHRAGAGRGRLHRRARRSSSRACAGSATTTGSSSSPTRCRPASARTGRFFAIEHFGVEPDLISVAKSIADGPAALGRARPRRDHGRAGRRRRRRHVRRQPGRAGGRARRARRDRRRGPRRAVGRDRRDDPRADARLAGALGRRSATCAGSARCSRSSSSPTRTTKKPATGARAPRHRARRSQRGLLLLTCGRLRQLHPRARPARDLRRRARGGARRLGRGARSALRLTGRGRSRP